SRCERLEVPLGEFRRPVERNRQRCGFHVGELKVDDIAFLPSEANHRFEPAVSSNHLIGAQSNDQGFNLTKAFEASAYRSKIALVVESRVFGIRDEDIEADALDL